MSKTSRNVSAIIFSLALFAFSGAALAAPVAEELQKRYDSITSIQSDFEQTLTHKESGVVEKRKGTLYFKKPLLVHWQTTEPAPELLVITSQEIWNYFEDEALAYKYPLSLMEDSSNIIRVITGQGKLTQDFDIEEKGQKNGLTELLLYPHKPGNTLVEAELFVDAESKLIKRITVYDFYGNINDITFNNHKLDPDIPQKFFEFTPPKGVKVEDRGKEGAGAKPGLL